MWQRQKVALAQYSIQHETNLKLKKKKKKKKKKKRTSNHEMQPSTHIIPCIRLKKKEKRQRASCVTMDRDKISTRRKSIAGTRRRPSREGPRGNYGENNDGHVTGAPRARERVDTKIMTTSIMMMNARKEKGSSAARFAEARPKPLPNSFKVKQIERKV